MGTLENAIDNTTLDLFHNINKGELIELNSDYNLYRYMDDDIIEIRENNGEEEAILQVMLNNKTLLFEEL